MACIASTNTNLPCFIYNGQGSCGEMCCATFDETPFPPCLNVVYLRFFVRRGIETVNFFCDS
jgi:hypothetical protein